MTGVADASTQVNWTEVDGVPVVWCEDRGPLRASLMFRVGKADEQLPTNGITHLVEHLALYRLGQQPHYQNGSVRTSITTFDSVGEVDEVTAFLSGVCAGLTDLPTDRREAEIRVLETEAARRANGTYTAALTWRYGPAGPGLWTYDEFAGVTADDELLQDWSDRMFCRENAVLVLSGPPPHDLRLPLREGSRQVPPYLVDVLAHNPAWFRHGFGDVAALAPLTRSAAAVAYTQALQHRLVEQLRFELGVAYSPSVDYDAYDATTALMFARADAHPDHLQAVADVLSDSIEHIADSGPDAERVDEHRERALSQYSAEGASLGMSVYSAMNFLLTGERASVPQLIAELRDMTYDDVTAAAIEARRRMVYALPETADLAPDRAWQVPAWSTEPAVHGQEIRPYETGMGRLTLGPDGLTHDFGEGRVATVRYATCRAVLAWPDGRRLLISPEAIAVNIEPTLWQDGRTVVASIDRNTAERQVPQPERATGDIPKPTGPRPPDDGQQLRNGALLIGFATVVIVVGVLSLFASLSGSGGHLGSMGAVVVGIWLGRFGFSLRRGVRERRH
jgi:hypothetical protein